MTERQLQIWVKIIQQEIDKNQTLLDSFDPIEEPLKYGYIKGIRDGFLNSWTWQSVVEEKTHS